MTRTSCVYFVDNDKAERKALEWGKQVTPVEPVIKNAGLYGDAGIDLFAAYGAVVGPQSFIIVDTFVGFLMEPGVAGLLWPRSGDNFLVGAGVIDTGYVGTVKVKIINPYNYPITIDSGDSVGQLVLFTKPYTCAPVLVNSKTVTLNTDRGENGRIVNQFNLQ